MHTHLLFPHSLHTISAHKEGNASEGPINGGGIGVGPSLPGMVHGSQVAVGLNGGQNGGGGGLGQNVLSSVIGLGSSGDGRPPPPPHSSLLHMAGK